MDLEIDALSIFNVAPLPMLLVNKEGEILKVNQQLCLLLDKPVDDLINQNLQQLFLTDNDGLWWFDYFWEEGTFNNIESQLQDQQQNIDILVSGSLIKKTATPTLFLLTIQDIGQLRRNQQALYEARLAAEQATKSKSQFLAHITHELKTPLNAIMGFSQLIMLNKKLEPEKSLQYTKQIYTSGQHLLSLINNLLDLSRLDAGGFEIKMGPVNIQEIMSHAIISLQPLLLAKKLTCKEAYDEEVLVLADPMRLKQVILNLLSNAIKYTPPKGVIDCSVDITHKKMIRISIADTGEGIAESQLEKLFLPFERLTQNNDVIEGTGIGLTISKRLTELMGGTIGVKTKINEGSIFYIDLKPYQN